MTPYSRKSRARSTKPLAKCANGLHDRTCLSIDKPYPAWRCEQTPSRIHQLLSLGAGLASAVAILATSLSIIAQLLCLCLLAMCFTRQWRKSTAFHILEHHGGIENTINEWSVTSNHGDTLQGRLVHRGYCSAGLLVMVFLSSDGYRSRAVPVWRDTVSASAFSYLNMQLKFNTYKPDATDKIRFWR